MSAATSMRTRAGLFVLAGLAASGCETRKEEDPRVSEEIERREAYAKALLVDSGASAYKVGNTADVHFQDGFSIVQFDPPDDWRSHAFRWMGQRGQVRLRTRGDAPMRLKVGGWVNEKVIDTKPLIRLYIDGQPIFPKGPGVVDDNQFFIYEVDVDPTLFHGKEWVNLDIVSSAVAWHWSDPPELRVLVLFEFDWRLQNER